MASVRLIKIGSLGLFALLFLAWAVSGSLSSAVGTTTADEITGPSMPSGAADDDYVGTETCKACHEDQFNAFSKTKHGKLGDIKSWKDKVQGCESCHGPGKAHVEAAGDKTKIISFKGLDSKAVSESCLACHAGKESHNNFRRGEHWRNNVGCTDCHTAHGPGPEIGRAGSMTLASDNSRQRPNQGTDVLLKSSEPQLCISCHNEIKSQFAKPFRHKVLEGTMRCSDCHNPHGGFETKQTKLAVGVDAACIKCHANKQGPFVFEHAPLKIEGCTACHIPHGSSNPRMLKRPQVRQLCFECHTGITDELASKTGVPQFHNQSQLRYQQCTVCHTAIHGSNSSSVFFR